MSNKKNEQNEKMDASTVYEMFEEIKEGITGLREAAQSTPAPASVAVDVSALDPEDRTAIRTLTAKLDENGKRIETLTPQLTTVSEKLDRPLLIRHAIDFMSNWVLIVLVVVVTGLFISLWIIRNQYQFRDNDLKYRYILMKGEATPADILQLRNVFEFNRNPDSIKTIRQQVERYEQLIQQQVENETRARLSDEQAKQLRQEAETIKGGK